MRSRLDGVETFNGRLISLLSGASLGLLHRRGGGEDLDVGRCESLPPSLALLSL